METAGVTRGQNSVYILPTDWARADDFLTPALARLDEAARTVQMVVITTDAEAAVALASRVRALAASRQIAVAAATSVSRAARVLRGHPVQVVAGDAATLVGLLQQSALRLADVSQVLLVWPDEDPATSPALETLLGELPKDAARTLVAHELSPSIEELIERYARRARRVQPAASDADATATRTLEYVTVHGGARGEALRRLLDALDPPRAYVYAYGDHSRGEAEDTLRTLGYQAEGPVAAGAALAGDVDVMVLYDLPATAQALTEVLADHQAARIVGLAQPRQLATLRAVARGALAPFTLPESIARARTHEEKLRDTLRATLAADSCAHELLALEPLLAEFDGVELAAAALHLLDAEKQRAATAPAHTSSAAPQRMVRLFINVGTDDGLRPGDLVGAVTNVGGIAGSDVGKVELRDRHSLVEVAEGLADTIASKLTGVTLKGRQLIARRDQERPARSSRPDRGDRGDRGDRSFRGERGDRGDRGDRGFRGDRGDRGDRSERPSRSTRPFQRPRRDDGPRR